MYESGISCRWLGRNVAQVSKCLVDGLFRQWGWWTLSTWIFVSDKYRASRSITAIQYHPLISILHPIYKTLNAIHVCDLQVAFPRIVVETILSLHLWLGTSVNGGQNNGGPFLKPKFWRCFQSNDENMLKLAKKDFRLKYNRPFGVTSILISAMYPRYFTPRVGDKLLEYLC